MLSLLNKIQISVCKAKSSPKDLFPPFGHQISDLNRRDKLRRRGGNKGADTISGLQDYEFQTCFALSFK